MAENFQDNVVFGQSSLNVSGNAIVVGDGAAGAKSLVFSNTNVGHLAWNPTANRTISLPDTGGVIALTSQGILSVSAGTTRATSGEIVFSNSNNVSFGLNGQTITASATVATSLTAVNISGGTTSNNLSAITFSNSNGISFGLNASTMTASVATSLTNVNLSAGTTSNNLSAFVFSNSNNISFGLNGSTVTASASVATSLTAINVSGGTTSNNLSAITFSNSNGISFGLNASTMTASVATSLTAVNVSGGTTSNNLSAITFSNSNGISFGLNASTMTASVATSLTNVNLSAGTTSNNLSAFVFSNSNGVSFGLNGSTVTASVAAGAANINFSAGTTSSGLGSVVFSNSNGISFGLNGSTITASHATSLTAVNVSAGSTSNNLSALTFADGNGVSFGLNASTVTASVAAQTNQILSLFASVNTTGQSSSTTLDARSVTLRGAGALSVGFSNSFILLSVPNPNISAGTTSGNINTIVFSNSNGVSFGLNGSTITASVATSLTNINVSGGTTSNNLSAITFSNSNGISFGLNGSTMTGSVATSLTAVNLSAGTTSNNLSAFVFSNSNGVSFGLNGSTVTASVAAGAANINFSAGTTSSGIGSVVFSNSNGVSFGLNGSTITATVAAQSNQTVGLYALGNTTQNSSTTLDARTLSYNALGAMTWGFSNGSIQVSAPATSSLSATGIVSISVNGSTISIGVPDSIDAVGADTQTATNGTVIFSNSNGVSFGMSNSSVITASAGYILSTYEAVPMGGSTGAISAQTATSNSCSFWPFILDASVSAGMLNLVASMNFVTMGTSSGRQSATHIFALYSRGTGANSTTLGTVASASFGLNVTYNNSTISISQPTTTNYTGYNTGSTTSAGSSITSGYTGFKLVQVPVNSLLTPGNYWLGMFARESTSSNSGGIKISYMGNAILASAMAPMGSFSTAFNTGTNLVGMQYGFFLGGVHTSVTTALPATLAISQFTNNLFTVPYMKFVST